MKVSSELMNLTPYQPGKPISETKRQYGINEVIKLASNENPLGVSETVRKALTQAIENTHRYPDAACYELLQKLSNKWNVPTSRLVVGNGSDELIDLIIRVYCESRESILTSQAAFMAYAVRAGASRVKVETVPLKDGYKFDLEAMAEKLRKERIEKKIRVVFIANPNNPTGTYNTKSEVDQFLKEFGNHPELVIVFDEAYNEFVRAKDFYSAKNYLETYNNVILLKTLSKIYGLAALRIGVMIAPTQTVDIVNRVRTPFNVNEFAQAAAIAALDDEEFVKKTCETTWQGLDYFYKELKSLGLPYIESQGNFVMFDSLRDVRQVNESLLKRGIIMRPILNYGFKTELRLSVGLAYENEKAIQALKEVLKEIPALK